MNFRRRPIFVQIWIETLCKRATSVAHLTSKCLFSTCTHLWNLSRTFFGRIHAPVHRRTCFQHICTHTRSHAPSIPQQTFWCFLCLFLLLFLCVFFLVCTNQFQNRMPTHAVFVRKPPRTKYTKIWPTFPSNFYWNFHSRCLLTSSTVRSDIEERVAEERLAWNEKNVPAWPKNIIFLPILGPLKSVV